MLSLPGQRYNKEQNPACLLLSGQQTPRQAVLQYLLAWSSPIAALPTARRAAGDTHGTFLWDSRGWELGWPCMVLAKGHNGAYMRKKSRKAEKWRRCMRSSLSPLPLSSSYFKKGRLWGTKQPKDELNLFNWKHFPIHKVMSTSHIFLCDLKEEMQTLYKLWVMRLTQPYMSYPVPENVMGGQLASHRGQDKGLYELLFFILKACLIGPSPTSAEANERTPADFNGSWIGPIVLCWVK